MGMVSPCGCTFKPVIELPEKHALFRRLLENILLTVHSYPADGYLPDRGPDGVDAPIFNDWADDSFHEKEDLVWVERKWCWCMMDSVTTYSYPSCKH